MTKVILTLGSLGLRMTGLDVRLKLGDLEGSREGLELGDLEGTREGDFEGEDVGDKVYINTYTCNRFVQMQH